VLTRTELKVLQAHRDYPSVSIIARTHRTAPTNKQDPIKVKNLVRQAIKRLQSEFKKREVEAVVRNLQELVKNIEWKHTLDGLALFAGKGHSSAVSLPFKVRSRAVVDETFATRDLVYTYNRAVPYRVLVLGHTVSLHDAWTDVMEEHGKPFPLIHGGPGGGSKLPGGQGINRSGIRDDAIRAFFRSVDDAFASVQRVNPLPLVVAGVERNIAFFQEVTSHASVITGLLAGNHEGKSPSELGKVVWPIFDAAATGKRTHALIDLDSAVDANRHASGLDQVWRAAVAGKVKTLLVEKDFHQAADLSEDGTKLLDFTGKGAAALDDVVDEVIERVMENGGAVFFYSPDDLQVHQKIAAVLVK